MEHIKKLTASGLGLPAGGITNYNNRKATERKNASASAAILYHHHLHLHNHHFTFTIIPSPPPPDSLPSFCRISSFDSHLRNLLTFIKTIHLFFMNQSYYSDIPTTQFRERNQNCNQSIFIIYTIARPSITITKTRFAIGSMERYAAKREQCPKFCIVKSNR